MTHACSGEEQEGDVMAMHRQKLELDVCSGGDMVTAGAVKCAWACISENLRDAYSWPSKVKAR
jgi:hypothetical protein